MYWIFLFCSKAFGLSTKSGVRSRVWNCSRTAVFVVYLPVLTWLVGLSGVSKHLYQSTYPPLYLGVCWVPTAWLRSFLCLRPISMVMMVVGIAGCALQFWFCSCIGGKLLILFVQFVSSFFWLCRILWQTLMSTIFGRLSWLSPLLQCYSSLLCQGLCVGICFFLPVFPGCLPTDVFE